MMKRIFQIIILVLRIGSGGYIFHQGYEKLTGGFNITGLIPSVRDNADSPEWYKWFFENVVAHMIETFHYVIPLGEMAIGLGLIFGVLAYIASFFGAFIMINYILAAMIFTYPVQLAIFIILLMNRKTLNTLSLKSLLLYFKHKGDDKHDPHLTRG